MTREPDIPQERLARNPLITSAGYRKLRELLEHPAAPAWNYEVGDRLLAEDMKEVELFRSRFDLHKPLFSEAISDSIIRWIEQMRPVVPLFQLALPEGFDIRRDWSHIPTTSRTDIVHRLEADRI